MTPSPRFTGRRRGRMLRPGQQRRLDTLLPRLAITTGVEPVDPATLFASAVREVWLEIGFGAGENLLAQARGNPDIGLIGCEPFLNGVASLLGRMESDLLGAIRLWTDDAALLLNRLPTAGVSRCFILFPDPWPKVRHHKRRFIAPAGLDRLARVLAPGGGLRVASDHAGYVRWILDHATRHPAFEWLAEEADDWLRRPMDQSPTRYERKALAGQPHYLCFRRR